MVFDKPQVDLYYSQSLLGHFTLIVYDRVDLIAFRVHFVDRGAEAAHGGKLAWLLHKATQITGLAEGRVLSDWKASPKDFEKLINYATENGRSLLRGWQISVTQMDNMLNWVARAVADQKSGHYGNYGYVVYSDNVDNCGSYALKCLAQASIKIDLPMLKSWIPLPSLIKNNIKET